jgi:type IV fimbrial biogenesis protein FimT
MSRPARRPDRPAHRRASGTSLVEVLVALAIAATLTSLGAAGWNRLAVSLRLTSYSNHFLTTLHLARSEAIKRNARVAICKSPDGEHCMPAGGWEQGWIVFHDANNNGARDAGETLVLAVGALPDGYRLAGNQSVSRYVSFTGLGASELLSGAFQAGTLTLCRASADAADARVIVISSVGNPRVQKAKVPSC